MGSIVDRLILLVLVLRIMKSVVITLRKEELSFYVTKSTLMTGPTG